MRSTPSCVERILQRSGQPLRRTWIEFPYWEEESTGAGREPPDPGFSPSSEKRSAGGGTDSGLESANCARVSGLDGGVATLRCS